MNDAKDPTRRTFLLQLLGACAALLSAAARRAAGAVRIPARAAARGRIDTLYEPVDPRNVKPVKK